MHNGGWRMKADQSGLANLRQLRARLAEKDASVSNGGATPTDGVKPGNGKPRQGTDRSASSDTSKGTAAARHATVSQTERAAGPHGANSPYTAHHAMAHSPQRTKARNAALREDADVALFRRVVKKVERIKDPGRASLPMVPQASAEELRQRRELAAGQRSPPGPKPSRTAPSGDTTPHTVPRQTRRVPVSDQFVPAKLKHDDTSFLRAGYGPDLIKGLNRGKWPIEASLDLHGSTLEEARERLDQFLQSCLTHQIKCVRVIHGKGYGSKGGKPVLKQTVRYWLSQIPEIKAYAECQENDGGAGAIQALLHIDAPET